MAQETCPQCGKLFTLWRGKKFCSEVCRKRDQNKRLRAAASQAVDGAEPVRRDEAGKVSSRSLRRDETALGEPLAELAAGISRVASMLNPTVEAIRRELAGWPIEDERTIQIVARRMRVAPTAVRQALSST